MDYIFSDGMIEKELIEVEDKNGMREFVLKRNIIEDKLKNTKTEKIAYDTIRWMVRNGKGKQKVYAGINCSTGMIIYYNKPFDTNRVIDLFNFEFEGCLDCYESIVDIYHDNLEKFTWTFDVKDKLDELYDQSFRKCKDCGGIVDNYKIEDEYYYDPEYPYRGVDGTHRTLYFKCRGCNKEDSICYVCGGEI